MEYYDDDWLEDMRELRNEMLRAFLPPAKPWEPKVTRAYVITPDLMGGIFPYENIPTNPDAAYIGEIDGIPVYIQNSPW